MYTGADMGEGLKGLVSNHKALGLVLWEGGHSSGQVNKGVCVFLSTCVC